MRDRRPPGHGGSLLTNTPDAPPPVRHIVETLESKGYETWTVGGAVRDALMGIPGGDWDLATRARPEEVRRAFRRTVPIGIEYGTVGVLDEEGTLHEVTTFRQDVETYGRRAVVEFSDSIEEDLSRRDFTINAVAWHPLRRELMDPFGGVRDMEDRILRTVGDPNERFAEDFLRVLRALRFAGRFELRIEASTWEALLASVGHLGSLSAERIREELVKVLEGREPPSRALSLYRTSGVLDTLYPELAATVGCPRPAGKPGDVWSHALAAVDRLDPAPVDVRLATLLVGAGAPERVPDHEDRGSSVEARGVRRAVAVTTRLRFSNATIQRVAALVGAGDAPPEEIVETDSDSDSRAPLRRWLHRHGPENVGLVSRIWRASAVADRPRDPGAVARVERAVKNLREELGRAPPLFEGDLAVDGRDLIRMGLKPGPRFGRILRRLLDVVLEDPSRNREDLLRELVAEWVAEQDASPNEERR